MHKLELDTRRRDCVIRVCYVPETVTPGNSYHIGSFSVTDKPFYECTQPIAIIGLTEHGDYVGGDVEASNYRVLAEDKSIAPHLIHLYGSHGYKGLAYQAYTGPFPPCEELADALESMQDYCLLDDDDHSALEMELETEAWSDDGRADFVRALGGLFDELDDDYEHDTDALIHDADGVLVEARRDLIDNLWREGCDVFNVNGGSGFCIETGCTVHFYIDEWCKGALAPRSQWSKFNDGFQRSAVVERIVHLARECRSDEYPDGDSLGGARGLPSGKD